MIHTWSDTRVNGASVDWIAYYTSDQVVCYARRLGYAMVDNAPQPGSVIAQALEDFEGEMGLIKAMIRKF